MLVYIFCTVLTIIFIYFAYLFYIKTEYKYVLVNRKFKKKKEINFKFVFTIFFSIIPLALASSFRDGVGTDYYHGYYSNFYNALTGIVFPREPLVYYLIKFIQLFTTNAQWFFIITSFIVMTFLTLSIIRMSSNWMISSLLIVLGSYYFVSLSNVRQSCAMAIATLAFSYACDKKYVRTILFTALSIGFHSSAVLLIPLFIICCIKNIQKYWYIILGVVLLFTPAYIPVINKITELLQYEAYFETSKGEFQGIYLLTYGIVYIICLIHFKKLQEVNKYTFGLMLIFSFAVIFSLMSCALTTESTIRMTCWFSWPMIFLIPSFTKICDNKLVSNTITIMLLCLVGYMTYTCSYTYGWWEVFPYMDIWGHII